MCSLADALGGERRDNTLEMTGTGVKKNQRIQTGNKIRPEPPWNVVLHNDWNNSMPRVVIILKRVIPGMSVKRATKIMWEAHTTGQAVVKRCHKELAELYKEQLQGEGLTVSLEPAS
jgi:ATP-dependent Clp protease adaptor protein ClpS